MVKFYVSVAAIALSCAGAYYLLSTDTEQSIQQETEQHEHSHHAPKVSSNERIVRQGKVLSTGKNMLTAKSNRKSDTSNLSEEPLTERDSIIWTESEDSQEILIESGTLPPDLAEEAYIEVDLNELNTVELGDSLDLYIPQLGGSYNGQVDHISNHPNGDRTVEAFIPGAGSLYSAVITIGENAIYGNIATQEDVFVLEGIGKHAWLAPKSAMIANHQERIPSYQPTSSSDQSNGDVFELKQNSSPTTTSKNK